jgi:hypothetical protein
MEEHHSHDGGEESGREDSVAGSLVSMQEDSDEGEEAWQGHQGGAAASADLDAPPAKAAGPGKLAGPGKGADRKHRRKAVSEAEGGPGGPTCTA